MLSEKEQREWRHGQSLAESWHDLTLRYSEAPTPPIFQRESGTKNEIRAYTQTQQGIAGKYHVPTGRTRLGKKPREMKPLQYLVQNEIIGEERTMLHLLLLLLCSRSSCSHCLIFLGRSRDESSLHHDDVNFDDVVVEKGEKGLLHKRFRKRKRKRMRSGQRACSHQFTESLFAVNQKRDPNDLRRDGVKNKRWERGKNGKPRQTRRTALVREGSRAC
jgi:hypothetical protein